MTGATRRIATIGLGVSAVVLAVSFFLPVAESTTYLRADGTRAGFLAQIFPDPSAATITQYRFPWQESSWELSILFFLPALLVLLRAAIPTRVVDAFDGVAPILGAMSFAPLVAYVTMADFGLNLSRAFGGQVALAASGAFVAATLVLAAGPYARIVRAVAARARRLGRPGAVCG